MLLCCTLEFFLESVAISCMSLSMSISDLRHLQTSSDGSVHAAWSRLAPTRTYTRTTGCMCLTPWESKVDRYDQTRHSCNHAIFGCRLHRGTAFFEMSRWTFFLVLLLGISTGDAHKAPLEHLRAKLKGPGPTFIAGMYQMSVACQKFLPKKPDFGTLKACRCRAGG